MTVAPMLHRVLRYGAVLAVGVATAGGLVGWLALGMPGLVGGVLGAVLAAAFLALTALSILLAGRLSGGQILDPIFFAVVLGGLVLKLVVFAAAAMWLHGQEWLSPAVFGWSAVAAVIGSLMVDVLAFQRSRLPYADVELPGDGPGEVPGDGADAGSGPVGGPSNPC